MGLKLDDFGLNAKLILLGVSLIFFSTTLVAVYNISNELSNNRAGLIERGLSQVKLLASFSEYNLYTETLGDYDVTRSLVGRDSVSYTALVRTDHSVIVDEPPGHIEQWVDIEQLKYSSTDTTVMNLADAGLYVFVSPVFESDDFVTAVPGGFDLPAPNEASRLLGYVVLALNDDEVDRQALSAVIFSGLATLCIAMVAVVLIYYYTRRITRPLRALAAMSRDIAESDFEKRIEVESNDEIGHDGVSESDRRIT